MPQQPGGGGGPVALRLGLEHASSVPHANHSHVNTHLHGELVVCVYSRPKCQRGWAMGALEMYGSRGVGTVP